MILLIIYNFWSTHVCTPYIMLIIITQRFYKLKGIVYRSFLTFSTCQTYGKMTSCQGPLAEVVRRVSSVSAVQRKRRKPRCDSALKGEQVQGADKHGNQLAYLGFQQDVAAVRPAVLRQHGRATAVDR